MSGTPIDVGTAYLSILPETSRLAGAIRQQLNAVQSGAGTSGATAGTQFGESFASKAGRAIKVGVAAATAAAGAAIASGLTDALNFEKARAKLSASLGATGKESEKLGNVAGKLYASAYGENLADVSEQLGTIYSSVPSLSKLTEADLTKASSQFLDFSNTFGVDVARAAEVAGIAIKSGLADNSTQALDQLTRAMQEVPANLREDVFDATSEYAGFFDSLGYSGEEALSLIANASDRGAFGMDKIGDAVKEFTIRATDMSTASQDAYKAIGLDAEELSTKIAAGGPAAAQATQQVIDGLLAIEDPARRANTAIALFGTPLEDLNVQKVPEFLRSLKTAGTGLGDFDGAISRAGKQLNDNAITTFTQLVRTGRLKLVEFLTAEVLPTLNKVLKAIGPVVRELSAKLAPAFEKVGNFLRDNTDVLLAGAAAFATYKATIVGLTVVTKVISAVTKGYAIVQGLLNGVMLANPVTLVAVALAALVAALVIAYKRSETFREVIDRAFSAIREAVDYAWTKVIKPALAEFVDFLKKDVMPTVTSLWENVVKPIFGLIGKLIGLWWNYYVKPIFKAVGFYLTKVLFPTIRFLWTKVVRPVFSAIGSIIRQWWEKVVGPVFRAVGDFITDKLVPAFETAKDKITSFFENLRDAARGPVRFLVETVYNDGLRKMIGYLPGVGTPDAVELGFANGGYTGPGGKYQPAGIVHADEFVIRSESRRKIESAFPGLLAYLNARGSLPGYSLGGSVVDVLKGAGSAVAGLSSKALDAVVGKITSVASKLSLDGLGSGPWTTMLADMARELYRRAADFGNDLLPGSPIPAGVFDDGGILPPGGVALNLSRKPEAVFTQPQLRDLLPNRDQRAQLVVMDDRFEALLRFVADEQIDTAARYDQQRLRMGV